MNIWGVINPFCSLFVRSFNELYTALGNGVNLTVSLLNPASGQILRYNGTNFVPSDYWIPQIEIYNLFENRSNVQFNHRTLGYFILLLGLLNVYLSRNNYFMLKVSLLTLLLIFVQITLGIFTIILMVPWETALLHQFFSLLVFSSITYSLYLSRFGK